MPNTHTLTEVIDVTQHHVPLLRAANTYTSGTYTDMSAYEGGVFLIEVGAMVATATLNAQVVQATSSAGAGSKNLTNAALVEVADTGGSKLYAIEFRTGKLDLANGFKFVGLTVVTANANVTFGTVLLRHRGRVFPVSTSLQQKVIVA